MKLYQPVLFVGLGGAGCAVGVELERKLREEICGPDGNAFRQNPGMTGMLPYQLPSCIQFVYADIDRTELDRIPGRVVPGMQHMPAAARTASYASLVPKMDSYPDLAKSLRLLASRETETWLPPSESEPRVSPLHRGAAQFPTVGRAALFGNLLDGVAPVLDDIQTALGQLSNSGEELLALGGRFPRGVDVFVAFSVAGGTGAGIFYDYLHLLGLALSNSSLRASIWPLVLMPSAFDRGLGGGRLAELNAARALLDLFRLVDDQNSDAPQLNLYGMDTWRLIDPHDVAVYYPVNGRIMMRPRTVQTGILFSRPWTATRDDIHRSIVSLVMSLIGTEISDADQRSGIAHQSFADSFVNEATHRQVRAVNGIGNRGVSTALVASLTVPVDELAGIVSARLLRDAIEQLSKPLTALESNRGYVEEFLDVAGAQPILKRPGPFDEPASVSANGAREVTIALNNRLDAMRTGIDSLSAQLSQDIPLLVDNFNPKGAVDQLLTKMDVFRLRRIVFGHPDLADELDRSGVDGLLHRRRAALPPPNKIANPPLIPEFRDRLLRKVQWSDEEIVRCRAQQDAWYTWRTRTEWARFWDTYSPQWRGPLEDAEQDLRALTDQLFNFARDDHENFSRRSGELYSKRFGVSYMLPPGAVHPMEEFYKHVAAQLRARRHRDGQAQPDSSVQTLPQVMVSPNIWRNTYKVSVEYGPATAVSFLLSQVKAEVTALLRDTSVSEQPMLPRLVDLLAATANPDPDPEIRQDYLDEFKSKLAGLLPATFTPQGSGLLKVLISYPAATADPIIEEHLKSSINLPAAGIIDFQNTHTEMISVVLFRTGMGLTEVGEVCDVLRRWAGALAAPQPTDKLPWRQRVGYNFSYLATNEEERTEILHHMLCALWNGRGSVLQGTALSPDEISITFQPVAMQLPLQPLGQASSWGSLLYAYERWALDDSQVRRLFCEQLMRELPEGLNGTPQRPDLLYRAIRQVAHDQIELLDDMIARQKPGQSASAARMRAFWAETLPAALDRPFSGVDAPIAENLLALEHIAIPHADN
jgi:hypothetical protein